MRKLIWTFAICMVVGLTSCSGSIEDAVAQAEEMAEEAKAEPTVVGFWELSDFDMGIEIPADQQAMFDSMKKEMTENSNISIKDDGTYSQNDFVNGEMTSQSGTYVIDGENLLMTVDGNQTTLTITKLTDSEMALSSDDNGSTIKMTYTRP